MKLAEHVDHLRELIEAAFDKQFARLGFAKTKQMDAQQVDSLPDEVKAKRVRFVNMLENHIGETGSYISARDKLLDELTFTLFNRLAAIKVMEAASLFPPILTKQIEHGDRSFGHKAWLEINPHMRNEELDGIREYLKVAFNELGQTLPLYSKAYPYALLPDAVSLNDIIDAYNALEQDSQVGKEIWLSDDVMGWMYESYNNKKKQAHKDSKDKTEYNKVSLQSQVYTPRWVVQFLVENSLGKMYLEMYPHSVIKQRYKIANAPTTQTRKPKPLHEVRIIDPACGSGNFLLYAFDFYYQLYLDQIENYSADYDEKDIPKLIIENNLHGIDLDDRAVQLAQLGLFIKAKKKRRNIGELNFRIVSSDFYLPEYNEVRHIFEQGTGIERNQQELIEKIWSDLRYAYKFGSLVHIDEQLNKQLHSIETRAQDDLFAQAELTEHQDFAANFFGNLTKAVEQYARTGSNTFLTSKTKDAITFLDLLTTEYDVATANPPYTDSSDFGPDLKHFIDYNYRKPHKFNTNLYATFIKRCFELTNKDGLVALIHPDTFMFINTFSDVRSFILNKSKISIFVHYPQTGGVFGVGIVYPAFYVLSKNNQDIETSTFFNIKNTDGGRKEEANILESCLNKYINNSHNPRLYQVKQNELAAIKTSPFIYWISSDFRKKFSEKPFEQVFHIKNGLQTGNNNRYLRYFWEIFDSIKSYEESNKWVLYGKGGPVNKWFGNLWLTVNTEETNVNTPSKGYRSEGISFAGTGARSSFRYMPPGNIFDNDAPLIYPKSSYKNLNYTLGYLNSKLVSYILGCLNPTVKTQVGDVKRIPFVIPILEREQVVETLSEINKKIKIELSKFSLIEILFCKSPITSKENISNYLNFENNLIAHSLLNDAIIDNEIFKIYSLTDSDIKMVLSKEGSPIGALPVTEEAKSAFVEYNKENHSIPLKNILGHINSLETVAYDDHIKNGIEAEFNTLYQHLNGMEEFCSRHKINPIDLWFWFKLRNGLPKQRVKRLAVEFLADVVRELLLEDVDGMIPLTPNSGEGYLLLKVNKKLQEKGFSTSQYSEIEKMLSESMNEFFHRSFFIELSDRLNLFQHLPKTPFIWHLTSGPERGFSCYIIIYKWSRDNLLRLQSVYIENRERALLNRQSDIATKESGEAQNEKELIFKQLKEIESFKKKIDELLAEGYNPILDDGVGKNIAPLQQKKMLAYDVLNAGQLKKYLNADW
tara:strand:+ start:1755 stop:5402 length:3648 start_codon:yes stop_codon:yes gene_type:complete